MTKQRILELADDSLYLSVNSNPPKDRFTVFLVSLLHELEQESKLTERKEA